MASLGYFLILIGLTLAFIYLVLAIFPISQLLDFKAEYDENLIRFHLIGDFGDLSVMKLDGKFPCEYVSEAMSARASKYPISMIITSGDNIYANTKEDYLNISSIIFSSIFSSKSLSNIPWLLTYGNHELYIDSEMNLRELFPFITMRKGVWTKLITKADFSTAFIFIPPEIACIGDFANKVVAKQCLRMNVTGNATEVYDRIIDEFKKFEANKSIDWRIVVLHYPIFSVAAHGMDSENLKFYLLPLLKRYKIDLVLTGHHHNMQYFWHNSKDALYKKQSIPSKKCFKDPKLDCGNFFLHCTDDKVNCPTNKKTCSNRISLKGNRGLKKYMKRLETVKGEEVHQVIQGSGGAYLDPICPKAVSPMSTYLFSKVEYGFSEIEISKEMLVVRFFEINDEEPIFESYIKTNR